MLSSVMALVAKIRMLLDVEVEQRHFTIVLHQSDGSTRENDRTSPYMCGIVRKAPVVVSSR